MAFDLHKLARAAEFSFSLGSVGIVRCKSLTSDLMSQARHRIKSSEAEGKVKQLARWLLGEMAKRPTVVDFKESDPIAGDSLTVEQLSSATDLELEAFSENVLKKNLYLTRAHGSEELKRVEGQSACDFLAHAIVHRGNEEKAQLDRIIQSATKPLFAESTLNSIKRSLAASNQFEDLIKKYSGKSALDSIRESIAASDQIEELGKKYAGDASLAERVLLHPAHEPQMVNVPQMHFPKNPIHETNQILENLTDQIDDMRPLVAQGAELIRSMNETALGMQADSVVNAARTDRQTTNATRVAVVSLVVSAVSLFASSWFSYQSYADSKSSGEKAEAQIKVFKASIETLVNEQRADRVAVLKSIAEANRSTPITKKNVKE